MCLKPIVGSNAESFPLRTKRGQSPDGEILPITFARKRERRLELSTFDAGKVGVWTVADARASRLPQSTQQKRREDRLWSLSRHRLTNRAHLETSRESLATRRGRNSPHHLAQLLHRRWFLVRRARATEAKVHVKEMSSRACPLRPATPLPLVSTSGGQGDSTWSHVRPNGVHFSMRAKQSKTNIPSEDRLARTNRRANRRCFPEERRRERFEAAFRSLLHVMMDGPDRDFDAAIERARTAPHERRACAHHRVGRDAAQHVPRTGCNAGSGTRPPKSKIRRPLAETSSCASTAMASSRASRIVRGELPSDDPLQRRGHSRRDRRRRKTFETERDRSMIRIRLMNRHERVIHIERISIVCRRHSQTGAHFSNQH